MTRVAIIDCGISNVGSVQNAFSYIGVDARLAYRSGDIADCTHVVLPGDGSFPEGMSRLKSTGLDEGVYRAKAEGKMILGICLGMQLLADEGEEFGLTPGLGLVPGRVVLMQPGQDSLPLPQVGWNDVAFRDRSRLGQHMNGRAPFYFMQSFAFSDLSAPHVAAQCEYGCAHVSAIERDNVLGVQFHPEKSQRAGLRLLQNFAEMG